MMNKIENYAGELMIAAAVAVWCFMHYVSTHVVELAERLQPVNMERYMAHMELCTTVHWIMLGLLIMDIVGYVIYKNTTK